MKTRTSPRSPRSPHSPHSEISPSAGETSPKAGLFLCALAVLALVAVQPARAATYVWTPTAAGTYNWDDATSNWTSGFPILADDIANLNINIIGAQTVDLNQAITIGTLNIGDTTTGFFATTLQNGTAGSLTFDVGAGSAVINKATAGNTATDIISATITLNDNINITNAATAASGALTISGDIGEGAAGKTLTKLGAGVLTLSGNNTYTGLTTVSAGTLTLSGANTGTGGVTLSAGTLNINSAQALGATAGTFTISGGTIDNTSGSPITLSTVTPIALNGDFTFTGGNSLNLGTGAVTLGATRTVTVSAGTLTVGGNIGDGSLGYGLNKVKSGILVLTGNNSYTGETKLGNFGGQLNILRADDGVGLPTSSNLNVQVGVFETGADLVRAGGTTAGKMQVTKVTANSHYSGFSARGGPVKVCFGTLATPEALTWGSGNFIPGVLGLILNHSTANNTLDFKNAVNLGTAVQIVTVNATDPAAIATMSGVLSSGVGGGLTKSGVGTLVLSNTNTYTGATTVSDGTLSVGADDNLGNANSLVFNGGTLQVTGTALTTFGTHTPTFNATKTVGLDINNAGNTFTVSQVLNQTTGGLTKSGAGTLVLSNANTYSGPTTVTAGTLNLSNQLAVQSSTLTMNGGSLVFDSISVPGNAFTFGGLAASSSGAGYDIALQNNAGSPAAIALTVGGNNANTTYAGALSGTGGSLTKSGTGSLTLSGANTYTGATGINAGTLSISNTATFTNTSAINLSGTGRLDVNVANQSLAKLASGTGTGVIAGTFLRYSQAQGSGTTGPGTILGTVELNLTNVNPNYTLDFGTGSTLTTLGSFTYNTPITLSGSATINAAANVFTGGTDMTVSSSTAGAKILTLTGTNTTASTIGGVISNGSGTVGVTKTGAGAWTLSGNTYTGGTVVSGGTIVVNSSSALGSGTVTIAGNAALTPNHSVYPVLNNSLVVNDGVTLTINNSTQYWSAAFNGVASGNGTIKYGGNNNGNNGWSLGLFNAANTFTGTLQSNGGSAALLVNSLADSANPIKLNGGAFTLNSGTAAPLLFNSRNITLTGTTVGATINNANATAANTITINTDLLITGVGAKTLTLGGANTGANTFAGIIANGTGSVISLTKADAGKWILSGNNTYTGVTTISAGTLEVTKLDIGGNNSSIGKSSSAAANLVFNVPAATDNATLRYTGAGDSTDRLFQVNTSNDGASVTLDASGSGALKFTNTGSPTFGTANKNPNWFLKGNNTGDNTLAISIIKNGGTANPTLTKSGVGTWILTGANTYTGATTVSAGTLVAGTNAPSGSAGAFGNAVSEVVLGVAGGNSDAGILIGGTFDVGRIIRIPTSNTTDAGTRVLTLGGNSAANSIFSGNIILGTASQAGRGVTLTAASGGQVTFSGVIQNPSSMDATTYTVTKSGLGTVVLSNANIYTGATSVTAGKLLINGNQTAATGAVTVNSGGTLGGSGTIGGAVNVLTGGTLAPGGSPGTLTVNNAIETWAVGGKYAWQLLDATGTAGTGFDLTAVTGTGNLAVTATSGTFNIVLQTLSSINPDVQGTPLNWDPNTYYQSWKIASSANAITGWDVDDGLASALFAIDATNFVGAHPTATFSVSKTGNDVYLNYVPEPATLALLGLGGLGLILSRKRK